MNGKLEDEIHYFKRMSGVLHLYFTILININSTMQCSLGIKTAWKWLADVLNLTPRPNTTAEILTVFFKCCGYRLQQAYGKQFIKLVMIFESDFLELIKTIPTDKQSGASVGRLESILEQFKKLNRFPEWKSAS